MRESRVERSRGKSIAPREAFVNFTWPSLETLSDDTETPLNLIMPPSTKSEITKINHSPSATLKDSWNVDTDTVIDDENSSRQEVNRGIKNLLLSRTVNENMLVSLPSLKPPKRKCGFCRQLGHRRDKCPKIAEFNSFD